MKPILTPAEAAELDRASQDRGIGVETLMENAGRAVAEAVVRLAGGRYGKRAVVMCGKGNNGGDGLVAARYFDAWGSRVTVLLLDRRDAFREPAATNLTRLERSNVRVRPLSSEALAREVARADVAIDAIFGTGFRGAPEGVSGSAIEALANADVPTVAVDIPSGVNGETGAVDGPAVDADITVTFGAAKPGVVLLPGAERAGVVEVADIGFPADLVHGDVWLVEAADVLGWVPERDLDTHKRSAGYAVVIGGSRTMNGGGGPMAGAADR